MLSKTLWPQSALILLLASWSACLSPGADQTLRIVSASGNGLELSDGSQYDFPQVSAGDSTTLFFLVHHAETAHNGQNPLLSTEGRMRSHHLKEVLNNAGIQLIFTTSENRSMSTIDVLSTMNSIQTLGYAADKAAELVQTVQEKDKGRRILIVGTATDLNAILEALYPETPELSAQEADFDGIILCRKGTQTQCKRFIY